MKASYVELCDMRMLNVEPYNLNPLYRPSQTRLHDGQEISCPWFSLKTSSQLLKKKVQNVVSKFLPSSSQPALVLLKEKTKWFTMCEL